MAGDAVISSSAARDAAAGVDALYRVGRARWPDVAVTPAQWRAWLAAAGLDLDDGRPRTAELFLAVASGHGDPAAIGRLRGEHLAPVVGALRRRGILAAADHDDAIGKLESKLWVATPSRAPAILAYQGTGPLRLWLHVVARRELLSAYRHLARAPAATPADDVVAALATTDSPAARLVAADSQAHVKAAYVHALTTLDARRRLVLRMHVCERLSLDAIASAYQVNRVTIARWLERARLELAAQVRARLAAALGLAAPEVDSILRAAQDDFELSVARLL